MTPIPTASVSSVTVDPRDPNSSQTTATVPIDAIGGERLNGFAPGSGVTIEVTGSRTIATLIVPAGLSGLDLSVIEAALTGSAQREGTDFAAAHSLRVVRGAPATVGDGLGSLSIDPEILRLFRDSELGVPVVRSAGGGGEWILVRATADTYLPGSRVYLVATSAPIIFGVATVGANGTAVIEGGVPAALLGEGGHRLRLVGTRLMDGVRVDADGGVSLTEETIQEIARFDRGTTATVRISGTAASGGATALVRFVPLRDATPWILLLVPATIMLLGVLLRRRYGHAVRLPAMFAVCAAAGLVAVIAYMGMYFDLLGVAIAVGLLGAAGHAVIRRRSTIAE